MKNLPVKPPAISPQTEVSLIIPEKNNKPWLQVLLVILVILLLGVTGFFAYQNKQLRQKINGLPEKSEQTENENLIKLQNELDNYKSAEKYRLQRIIQKVNEDTGLEKYSSDLLHLSFSYPQSWGVISISESEHDITLRLTEFENNSVIFLFASNPSVDPPGRGAFWGDAGHSIIGESLIKNFCQSKIDFVPSKNGCTVLRNKNNVLVSRVQGSSDCNEGGCSEKAPQANYYYLYNPYSEYKGVVLSFERLIGYNITDLEDKFNQIVESIEFIK